jgi:hypothetical protein
LLVVTDSRTHRATPMIILELTQQRDFSILSLYYRQVPRKPRLVGGDESAQFKNNKLHFRDAPRCARGTSLVRMFFQECGEIV